MKKTTVRFAAVGTVLLLGALAIALAQHDSRQRPRESQAATKPIAAAPQPILVDAIEPPFASGSFEQALSAKRAADTAHTADTAAAPLVRANDNPTPGMPPSLEYDSAEDPNENPLRPGLPDAPPADQDIAPIGAAEDSSAIALASGEEAVAGAPPSLSTLPSLPSTLGAQPLPVQGSAAAANLPAAPPSLSGALAGGPSTDSALGGPSGSAANTLSSPPPGWVNSGPITPNQKLSHQSLSDTQRPAMPATSLQPTTRGGGGPQSWLQAPAMPSGSSSPTGPRSPLPSTAATAPTGTGPIGTSPIGTSPVGTSSQAAQPMASPPSAAYSRLSDDDSSGDSAPAATQPTGQPALPTTSGLGAPPASSPSANAQPYPFPPAGSAAGSATIAPLPSAQAPSAQPLGMAPTQTRGQLASGNARTLLAGTAIGMLVSNQPGNRHLDGSQNPIMLIQKRTAGECQVGKRATIVITVRNSGNATAHDVQVIDSVPSGASFAEAMPAVTPTADGMLVWDLGEMAPGDERTINLQIIPERQGELGSVASVRFAAQASVRTLATLPKLELAYTAAPEVLIGNQHALDVVVKNVGTGVARNVRLEADLPAGIRHESGDAGLEASFGDIAPGEDKHIRLSAIAAEAGNGVCTIRALTDDGLQQEQKIDVQVLAPALQATITGPSKRYMDRQATFEVAIRNTGTAAASNCEFVLRLPAGLNFNTANKHGTYDPDQHAVLWSVPEFPAGHTEAVELTVLPVEAGTLAMTFQGMADLGVKTEAQGSLTVEEQAELAFTIEQDADPIELSASTTYTVEVRNIGRVDHNVQVIAQLPPGSKLLKVDAPVKYAIQGDQLLFEPVPQMDSRASHKFRFEVQHAQAGTQIVRAQLKSQNRPTPVIKEEATDVYDDRN